MGQFLLFYAWISIFNTAFNISFDLYIPSGHVHDLNDSDTLAHVALSSLGVRKCSLKFL